MVSGSLSEKSGASSITKKSSSRSTAHQRRKPGAGCIDLGVWAARVRARGPEEDERMLPAR
jgi:hypothetical protein